MQINPFSNNIYRPFLFLSLFEKNTLGKKRSDGVAMTEGDLLMTLRTRMIPCRLEEGGDWLKKGKEWKGNVESNSTIVLKVSHAEERILVTPKKKTLLNPYPRFQSPEKAEGGKTGDRLMGISEAQDRGRIVKKNVFSRASISPSTTNPLAGSGHQIGT